MRDYKPSPVNAAELISGRHWGERPVWRRLAWATRCAGPRYHPYVQAIAKRATASRSHQRWCQFCCGRKRPQPAAIEVVPERPLVASGPLTAITLIDV